MLELATKNGEFKNVLIGLITEGIETCTDRTTLLLCDIETQWKLYSQTSNETELVELLLAVQRYEALKTHAKKIAGQLGNHHEEIETILYFIRELHSELNLPVSVNNMRFPNCSEITNNNKELLLAEARTAIRSISAIDLLSTSPYWVNYLQKMHPEYPLAKNIQKINDAFTDILSLTPNDTSPADLQTQIKQIEQEHKITLNLDPKNFSKNIVTFCAEMKTQQEKTICAVVKNYTKQHNLKKLSTNTLKMPRKRHFGIKKKEHKKTEPVLNRKF